MNYLVTGGCSFSTVWNHDADIVHGGTWPHVLKLLWCNNEWKHISTADEGQGNGLISRRLIYVLTDLLFEKKVLPEKILVGVMWSGPARAELYCDYKEGKKFNIRFINESTGAWQLLLPGATDFVEKFYYKNVQHQVSSQIFTYEHVLRLQWFLKYHGIKYFMTTYTSEVFPDDLKDHSDIKHLHNQVDWSKFLPIKGAYEWCRDYSNISFPVPGDMHPGFKQHRAFTERVIIPFINNL